jgi:hypothetical protein
MSWTPLSLSKGRIIPKGAGNTKKTYLSPYSKGEVKSIIDSGGIKHVTLNPDNQHLDPSGVAQNTTRYSTPLGSLNYHITGARICDSDGIGLLSFLLAKRTLSSPKDVSPPSGRVRFKSKGNRFTIPGQRLIPFL